MNIKTFFKLASIGMLISGFHYASAAPIPEGFEGIVTKVSAQQITIKNDERAVSFDIRKAGVCGWPTKKRVIDVFKMGDSVIAYYFGEPNPKNQTAALNIFFSDEEKVRAFQERHQTQRASARGR